MRLLVQTSAIAACAILLSACEDAPDLNIEDSPSIVAEDEAAEAEPIFRAVGQEPGWFLRVFDDVMVYEADYGERTVTVRTPEVELFDGGRRYENEALIVEILDQACSDSMSGAAYSATVTITEDGRSPVAGCGGTS